MPLVLASDCFCIRDGLDPCEVLWASFLGLEGSLASRASDGSDDDVVHLVRFVFSLSFILSVSYIFILSRRLLADFLVLGMFSSCWKYSLLLVFSEMLLASSIVCR